LCVEFAFVTFGWDFGDGEREELGCICGVQEADEGRNGGREVSKDLDLGVCVEVFV
jgi:hypothetical protein